MTNSGRPGGRPPWKWWSDVGPLVLAAALVVGGVALIVATQLGGGTAVEVPSSPATPSPPMTSAPTPSSPPTSTPGVSPTPLPTPTMTALPTSRAVAETAIDLTWRSVAPLPGTAPDPATQWVVVSGLAHGPSGYLAVGEIVDGVPSETGATGAVHPAVWSSPDGTAWQLDDARGLGSGVPAGIAATPRAVVILSLTNQGAIILREGQDGSWAPATPPDSRIGRIGASGTLLIAVGERVSTGRQAIWTSVDGTAWQRAWESGLAAGEQLAAIAGRSDGSIVIGGSLIEPDGSVRASVVVSPDGAAWTRVPDADLPAGMALDAIGVGADGSWYGAGFDDTHGGIGVWRSADGTAWSSTTFGRAQVTEIPGDTGSATAVFAFDGRTVVLAYTSCCGDPPQRALISTNGRDWARADRSTAVRSVRLSALLVEPDRVLAVGGVNQGAGVWVATAAPRAGVEFATELAPPAEADVCGGGTVLHVQVQVDRTGTVARVRLLRLDEAGVELSGVIWPYGWQATAGPPLTIRDAAGHVVIREGDDLTLSNGTVVGASYHVCELNGTAVWGG
jgi:hypothetical protein